MLRRITTGLAFVLLAIFRTVYCWFFVIWSFVLIRAAYARIQNSLRMHSISAGIIVGTTSVAVFCFVFAIAWWMILSDNPATKRWAIVANALLIFNYFPVIFWDWRAFLHGEQHWVAGIVAGIIGIIIFNFPYRGWRHESHPSHGRYNFFSNILPLD